MRLMLWIYNKHMLISFVEWAKEVLCGRRKKIKGAKEEVHTKERQEAKEDFVCYVLLHSTRLFGRICSFAPTQWANVQLINRLS